MNKEELLEKSRKENKNANLADTEVTNKGAIWSACVMAILSLVFYAAETMVTGKTNSAFFAIIAVYNATLYLYKSFKQKGALNIITAVIWTVLSIGLIVSYFMSLFARSAIL